MFDAIGSIGSSPVASTPIGAGSVGTTRRVLFGATGSVALAGQAAALTPTINLNRLTITAAIGAQPIATRPIASRSLARKIRFPAATGAYALTGYAALLQHHVEGFAGVGQFHLTGVASGLRVHHRLLAAPGAYAATFTDAEIHKRYPLYADAGALAFDGGAIHFQAIRRMLVSGGAFDLTSFGTQLHFSRHMLATGSFILTGHSARFTGTGRVRAQFRWLEASTVKARFGHAASTDTNFTVPRVQTGLSVGKKNFKKVRHAEVC
jgi:hypothetical protein